MKEKETYQKPEVVFIEFSFEDSIATSGQGAIGGEAIFTPGE